MMKQLNINLILKSLTFAKNEMKILPSIML